MYNSLTATAGTVGVWLLGYMEQSGEVPFWVAFAISAFFAAKAGRAVFRIVVRGDP